MSRLYDLVLVHWLHSLEAHCLLVPIRQANLLGLNMWGRMRWRIVLVLYHRLLLLRLVLHLVVVLLQVRRWARLLLLLLLLLLL